MAAVQTLARTDIDPKKRYKCDCPDQHLLPDSADYTGALVAADPVELIPEVLLRSGGDSL